MVPENRILTEKGVVSGEAADMPTDATGKSSKLMEPNGAEVTRFRGCVRIPISDGQHESPGARAQAGPTAPGGPVALTVVSAASRTYRDTVER